MPIAAIHSSIFNIRRVRELFYPEWNDDSDVLKVVSDSGWYPLTPQQRKGLESYFSEIQNMTKVGIFAEMKKQSFQLAHAKAITDWKAVWKILIQKSKFNALFTKELRSQELDVIKLISDWELENEKWTNSGEHGPGPGPKPTPGCLHSEEKSTIHEWIFGSAGFTPLRNIAIPKEKLYGFTEAAYMTAWDRDSKKRGTSIQTLRADMMEISKFWNSWIDPTVLKLPYDLKKWVRLLEKAKKLATWLCDTNAEQKLESYLSNINSILASKDEELFQQVGVCTLSLEQIRRMADMINEAEFLAMSVIWCNFLSQSSGERPIPSSDSSVPEDLRRKFLETTMGVEAQLGMSSKELLISMGAQPSADGSFHVLPSLNCATPVHGWYAWEEDGHSREQSFQAQVTANEERINGIKGTERKVAKFVPLDLRWHQLCGIHAMLTHISTPQDASIGVDAIPGQVHTRKGLLVSDEVGVGKTAQIIGVISQIMYWKHLHETGEKLPPLHDAAGGIDHFVGGEFLLPEAPHVIVAPVSLIPHWEREIKTWMGRNAEVLVYTGGYTKHTQFFGPTGPYQQSKQEHIYRRIILVSTTALASDVKALVDKRVQVHAKGIARQLSSATGRDTEHTILHMNSIGVLVVDEAHEHRTGGARFDGLLMLRDRAMVVISATATPLYTGSRDLRNIGRINNLAHFMTEDAEIAESTAARVAARVRKLQKELKEERDDEQQEQTRNDLYDALAEMLLDVSNIRRAFGNTIIRRELDSVGEHGKGTITGMKPFWHQKAYLELSDVERAHIAKIEELVSRDLDIREDIDSINLLFESSGFYLRLRQASINSACIYALLSGERPPRVYTSIADFDERGSTKEKTVIDIIKHHMPLKNRQQNPLSWTKEGLRSIETRACGPPTISRGGCTKFVIYTEFTSLMKYLESALKEHGLPFAVLTGESGNAKKRAEIVEKFQREEDPTILLLSNVGKVGINLSAANILIVMDPLFSNQEFRQIVGRVWRYPQDRQVIVYQLVALGTADTTLQDIADNKDTLLNAFNSTNTILREILGDSIDEVADAMEEDMEDDMDGDPESEAAMISEGEHKKPKKGKSKSKTAKKAKTMPSQATGDADTGVNPLEKSKGKEGPSQSQKKYHRKKGKERAQAMVAPVEARNESPGDTQQLGSDQFREALTMESDSTSTDEEERRKSNLLDPDLSDPLINTTTPYYWADAHFDNFNVVVEENEDFNDTILAGEKDEDFNETNVAGKEDEEFNDTNVAQEEGNEFNDTSHSDQDHIARDHSMGSLSSGDEQQGPPGSIGESEMSEHANEVEHADDDLEPPGGILEYEASSDASEVEPADEPTQKQRQGTSQSGLRRHFVLSHTPLSKSRPAAKRPRYDYDDEDIDDKDEPRPKRGRVTPKQQEARDIARKNLRDRRHPEERDSPATSADELPSQRRVLKARPMTLMHGSISLHRKPGA